MLSSIFLQARLGTGSPSPILFILLGLLLLWIIKKVSWTGVYRIVYYLCRQNLSPDSSFCMLSLLMVLKSSFKKGLKKKTYKNISNWNLVYEIGNRYSLSFLLYGRSFSCTVIADAVGGIDFQNLDIQGIQDLEK